MNVFLLMKIFTTLVAYSKVSRKVFNGNSRMVCESCILSWTGDDEKMTISSRCCTDVTFTQSLCCMMGGSGNAIGSTSVYPLYCSITVPHRCYWLH